MRDCGEGGFGEGVCGWLGGEDARLNEIRGFKLLVKISS
jgi:hypothetical protein